MQLHIGVFERTAGIDTISARRFFLLMTFSVVWGLYAAGLFAGAAVRLDYSPTIGTLFLCLFALPVTGAWIAIESRNPLLSFIGYHAIVLPLGFGLAPIFESLSPNLLRNSLMITAGVSSVIGIMSATLPASARKWWRPVLIASLSLMGIRLSEDVFPLARELTAIDYAFSGVFSAYIAVNVYRASLIVKSVDNAIDTSVDLYLNIPNQLIIAFGFDKN
jgi:hypothetical protein